ncbi:winged helix-turn-helix domain-containing protein [Actinomadura sp. DC4]|uniref:ArsR/SmtB family transcription factor n=1 Tax=Actinomadura sp. DC4 TaxID=3055069 RepID=UPI0025B11666|nr:winged helix-turn-helix domain-containing protein [Actinomadura sp. DC4]MDN3357639.1 winged helix-turn-helix domain-containing protein [Actinomadura sp. DC4]
MSEPFGSDIAPVAALLADRTRAVMLTVLLDGRPLAAGELARTAGVSAATASSHLAKLLDGGLVTVVKQGRHRYYRLNGAEVAAVIEALSVISPPVRVCSLRQSRQAAALAQARTCYDHLAGRAGAALFDAMLGRGLIERHEEDAYDVTEKGRERLEQIGVDVDAVRGSRRRFAGHCLDWTERRPHLNGALGAAVTAGLVDLGWFERGTSRRSLVLTEKGRSGLSDVFGCVVD